MMKLGIQWLVSLVLMTVANMILAQPDDRPSETEINTQKIFIEANKEKLLGDYEEAQILYEEVVDKDKDNHAAFFELAKIHLKLHQKKKALENAKKAHDLETDNQWYAIFYADLLTNNNDYVKAAEVYKTIVEANPYNPEHYYEWAYLLTKANKIGKAIEVYNQLEDKIGVNEKTARHKHTLYSSTGRKAKAAGELEKLIKIYPVEPQYYHYLAQYYEQIGEKAKAKAVYEKVIAIAPDDPIASIALAEAYKERGDEANYLRSIKELFKKGDVDIDLKVKELYPYISKLPDVSEEVTKEILELSKIIVVTHPNDPKSYSIYADLLYYSGSPRESLVQYNKTLQLDNSVFSVWEQVMFINLELREIDQLLKISEEALDLFPNQAVAYYLNGVANGLKKNHQEAVDVLENALMMVGRDITLKYKIHSELGARYHALKQHKNSDKNFEAALQLNPKDYYLLNNYSYYLSIRGEALEKAKMMAETAVKLAPDQYSFQDTYGWVLYKMGDYKKSKLWLEKAIGNGGDNSPAVLEHYGDVLYQLNKVVEAVGYWQKAKAKGANSKILDKKITERKLYE